MNRDFTNGIGWQTFMTACCVVLNPDGSMRFSSAGHPPILVRRSNGRVESHGPDRTLLGVEKQPALDDACVRLDPGDVALLYTDGLYALKSKTGERFTHEIVEEMLAIGPLDQEVIGSLIDRIKAGTNGTPVEGDLTVIVLERQGT